MTYPHPEYWVLKSDRDQKDFFGAVIIQAPHNWNNEGKPEEWHLTTDIAFDILRAVIEQQCQRRRRLAGQQPRLHAILNKAYDAFMQGDRQTGMDEVYRLRVAIFGHIENGKRTYEYFPELDTGGMSNEEWEAFQARRQRTTVVSVAGVGDVASFEKAFARAKADAAERRSDDQSGGD